MYILQKTINDHIVNLNIKLGKETSKTIISYLVPNYDYKINSIMSKINDVEFLINQHNMFQKPIIELRMPNCFAGKFLDELTSKMSNSTKNTFSKLRIIDAYRVFEYDGWDWKLVPTLNFARIIVFPNNLV